MQYAELQGADLIFANLQGAKLEYAELQGADLRSAELQGADLRVVQLQGANLDQANLQGVDFEDAQLQGANLDGAHLQGANFYHANLGTLNISEKEVNTLIKIVPQDREARKNFEQRLRSRLGERAIIEVSEGVEIRHSYPSFNEDTIIKIFEKPDPFPRVPFVFFNLAKNQIQFKGIPTQTYDENLAMRQDIYRPLLCDHPILIEKNLEPEKWPSPLSHLEAIGHTLKNCPKYLPEKYKKSMTSPKQGSPSAGPG